MGPEQSELVEELEEWLLTDARDGRGYAVSTTEELLKHLARFMREGLDLEVWRSGEDTAQRVARAVLAAERRKGKPWAFNSAVRVLNALSDWCGYDISWKRVRTRRSPPKALEDDDLQALLRCDKLRHRALAQFQPTMGLRLSELHALRLEDLDPDACTVYVRAPQKGGIQRTLPAPRELFHPKRPFWAYVVGQDLEPGDRVWNRDDGEGPLTKAGLKQDLYKMRQETGIPFNCTIARHTAATRLLRGGTHSRGLDIRYVQFFLGHAAISSTTIYAEVTERDLERAYRRSTPPSMFKEV